MVEMEQAKGNCSRVVERWSCAMQERFLPIGIQTFEDIRDRNAVYVDKTDLAYRMVKTGNYEEIA
jgi:hypothetical protein